MNARINGASRTVAEGSTIADLLAELALATEGIAVAVDGHVVRRATFGDVVLREGADVEIIRAVAGG